MGKRHEKAWMFALARVIRKSDRVPKESESIQSDKANPLEETPASVPFYESTLLWGALSAVIALVSVYLGFALKDIRWFLAIAWPFCVLVVVSLAKAIRRGRHVHGIRLSIILLGSSLCGFGLWQLARTFPPPSNQDIGQQIDQALKKWNSNSQTGGTTQQPTTTSNGTTPLVRSYLVMDGVPRFTGKSASATEGSNFQPGDALAFNLHFSELGSNAIFIGGGAMEILPEPDYRPETLETAYRTFLENRKADKELRANQHKEKWNLFTPSSPRWDSVFAFDRSAGRPPTPHILTQPDLDKLRSGTLVAVVFVVIDYKDGGAIHHFWLCNFLQPPAQSPGIWHGFDVCPNSD
jgi:hypothetical protein